MEQSQVYIEKLNSYHVGPFAVADVCGPLILVLLFMEMMACSLLFQLVTEGSNAPPAISGTFIMWSVGVIGFQVALIPTILVSFHNNFRIRLAISFLLAIFFWAANWISWYVSGFSPSDASLLIASFPLGCAIAILPIGIPTLFLRLRLTRLSDESKGKPLTIGKLMGLSAAAAIVTAYAMQVFKMSGTQSIVKNGAWIFATGIGVAGLVLLMALFGLRKQRRLSHYFLITFGILFMVAWGGVWVTTIFFSRARVMQGAFYLSISLVSLIVHSALFIVALKLLRFHYRKVESQLRA